MPKLGSGSKYLFEHPIIFYLRLLIFGDRARQAVKKAEKAAGEQKADSTMEKVWVERVDLLDGIGKMGKVGRSIHPRETKNRYDGCLIWTMLPRKALRSTGTYEASQYNG